MVTFTWDVAKNEINKEKHGVDFNEAQTIFFDEYGLIIDDHEHSKDEERYILIGMSSSANLLVVCHTYRSNDEIIRIISARKATKKEANQYALRRLN